MLLLQSPHEVLPESALELLLCQSAAALAVLQASLAAVPIRAALWLRGAERGRAAVLVVLVAWWLGVAHPAEK